MHVRVHATAWAPCRLVPGEVINKIPVAVGMTPAVYGYLLEQTREPQVSERRACNCACMHASERMHARMHSMHALPIWVHGACGKGAIATCWSRRVIRR